MSLNRLFFNFYYLVEGSTSPAADSDEFYQYSPTNGEGVLDGIKGDNLRFQTTASGFVVITLGQSQLIRKVRVYNDEVKTSYNSLMIFLT